MKKLRLGKALLLTTSYTVCLAGMAAYTNMRMTAESDILPQSNHLYVSTQDQQAFTKVIDKLAQRRVIFIGETHNRYDHHQNQLSVLKELNRRNIDFAIGVEFFQQHFQQYLDAYTTHKIGEDTMLESSEYNRRWGFDFSLYRPILTFARENNIQIIALNAPSELVREVSSKGWQGVSAAAQGQLPAITVEPGYAYKNRLWEAYMMHSQTSKRDFERFVHVQLLWDEYMARSASNFLRKNPHKKLVILAGSGHVKGGIGIPERLQHLSQSDYLIVLNGQVGEIMEGSADVVLLTSSSDLTAKYSSDMSTRSHSVIGPTHSIASSKPSMKSESK